MIDRHYVTTIDRYAADLGNKSALMVFTGAKRELMREVLSLSKTITTLAAASLLDDEAQGELGNE